MFLRLSKQSIKWFYTHGLLWAHRGWLDDPKGDNKCAACLCCVKETPPLLLADWQKQGKESGSFFSSKAVIIYWLGTLIWKCGNSLTLHYRTDGEFGVSLQVYLNFSCILITLWPTIAFMALVVVMMVVWDSWEFAACSDSQGLWEIVSVKLWLLEFIWIFVWKGYLCGKYVC